jgi:5,5'-dehydrodivanillate O-demethylase
MLTQEVNDRLTKVGPGTPMGEMMRRYWHPIGTVPELEAEPVQPIRLLGENLTLFRSERG